MDVASGLDVQHPRALSQLLTALLDDDMPLHFRSGGDDHDDGRRAEILATAQAQVGFVVDGGGANLESSVLKAPVEESAKRILLDATPLSAGLGAFFLDDNWSLGA